MIEAMDSRQKQERRNGQQKKGSGCVIIAVILVAVAILAVLVGAFFMFFWARKAVVMEGEEQMVRAEAMQMASESRLMRNGDEEGLVMLTEELIARMSATDFGDGLSREHFVAAVLDDHATDLMRKQFAEKANGMRVSWLLRVDDVSAPDSNGAIRAPMSMPYRIAQGHGGWAGSSVSVIAEFGPDAVDDLLKVRRGEWVKVEGELKLESNGRSARILGARVVE